MSKFNENKNIIDHLKNASFPGNKMLFLFSVSLRVQQNGYTKSPNLQMHHLLEKKSEI
jgi:hypothetical protein